MSPREANSSRRENHRGIHVMCAGSSTAGSSARLKAAKWKAPKA